MIFFKEGDNLKYGFVGQLQLCEKKYFWLAWLLTEEIK